MAGVAAKNFMMGVAPKNGKRALHHLQSCKPSRAARRSGTIENGNRHSQSQHIRIALVETTLPVTGGDTVKRGPTVAVPRAGSARYRLTWQSDRRPSRYSARCSTRATTTLLKRPKRRAIPSRILSGLACMCLPYPPKPVSYTRTSATIWLARHAVREMTHGRSPTTVRWVRSRIHEYSHGYRGPTCCITIVLEFAGKRKITRDSVDRGHSPERER
jgi:hypothetical protein